MNGRQSGARRALSRSPADPTRPRWPDGVCPGLTAARNPGTGRVRSVVRAAWPPHPGDTGQPPAIGLAADLLTPSSIRAIKTGERTLRTSRGRRSDLLGAARAGVLAVTGGVPSMDANDASRAPWMTVGDTVRT